MSAAFDVLVGAHIGCAVVGFGSCMLAGVYGFGGRRPGRPEAVAEARRWFRASSPGELLVLPVPFLGAAALAVQRHGQGFGRLWVLLAALVWLASSAVLFGVVRPAERELRKALTSGDDEQVSADGSLLGPAARIGWGAVAMDVGFALALVLMIFQPG